MMKNKWIIVTCVTVGVLALGIAPGYAQEPTITGSWSFTYFSEPNHTLGLTQCIVFTLNPNSVVGEPLSGQWSSTTFANWTGDWFQEGEHVQLFGSTGGGLATQFYGDLASNDQSQGKFQTYFPLNPGSQTSNAGAWVASRVQACTAAAGGTVPANSDPTKAPPKVALISNHALESPLASLTTTTLSRESAVPEIAPEAWLIFELD